MIEEVGAAGEKNDAINYIRHSADAGRVEAKCYLGRGYVSGQIGQRNTPTRRSNSSPNRCIIAIDLERGIRGIQNREKLARLPLVLMKWVVAETSCANSNE
jgi:hypothetical protein